MGIEDAAAFVTLRRSHSTTSPSLTPRVPSARSCRAARTDFDISQPLISSSTPFANSRSWGLGDGSAIGWADIANVGMVAVRIDCPDDKVTTLRPNSVMVHTSSSNHTWLPSTTSTEALMMEPQCQRSNRSSEAASDPSGVHGAKAARAPLCQPPSEVVSPPIPVDPNVGEHDRVRRAAKQLQARRTRCLSSLSACAVPVLGAGMRNIRVAAASPAHW